MSSSIASGLPQSLPAKTEPAIDSNDLGAVSKSFKTATLGFVASISVLYGSVFLLSAII